MVVAQVTLDMSVPPSPASQSLEMDICHIQSEISSPSFLSFPESSGLYQESPSSVRAHENTCLFVCPVLLLRIIVQMFFCLTVASGKQGVRL